MIDLYYWPTPNGFKITIQCNAPRVILADEHFELFKAHHRRP